MSCHAKQDNMTDFWPEDANTQVTHERMTKIEITIPVYTLQENMMSLPWKAVPTEKP